MPVVIRFFFKDDGPFLARLIEPDFEPRCITADTGQSVPLSKQYQRFGKIECVAHGIPSRIIFSGRVRARGKRNNLGNNSQRFIIFLLLKDHMHLCEQKEYYFLVHTKTCDCLVWLYALVIFEKAFLRIHQTTCEFLLYP